MRDDILLEKLPKKFMSKPFHVPSILPESAIGINTHGDRICDADGGSPSETGLSNTQFYLKVGISTQANHVEPYEEPFDIGIHWVTAYSDPKGISLLQLEGLQRQFTNLGSETLLVEGLSINSPNPNCVPLQFELRNEDGSFLRWGQREDGNFDCWFKVTGENLESGISKNTAFLLLRNLHLNGLHLTRIDLAITDRSKLFSWQHVIDAAESGNYTGYRQYYPRFSPKKIGKPRAGITAYFGSRNSDKMTRIYDTKETHKYAANKVETQFEGKQAKLLGEVFYEEYEKLRLEFASRQRYLDRFIELCRNYVLGSIDFIDRTQRQSCNGSLKKCPRLSWWQKFCDAVGGERFKLKLPKREPSLKANENWLRRQVLPSLAMRFYGLGRERFSRWVEQTVTDGLSRLNSWQQLGVKVLETSGERALGVVCSTNPAKGFGQYIRTPRLA